MVFGDTSLPSSWSAGICVLVCLTLWDSLDCSPPDSFCLWNFFRQEYWSGLPLPTLRDLPDPGIKPMPLVSPALAGRFFTTSAIWETSFWNKVLVLASTPQFIGLSCREQSEFGVDSILFAKNSCLLPSSSLSLSIQKMPAHLSRFKLKHCLLYQPSPAFPPTLCWSRLTLPVELVVSISSQIFAQWLHLGILKSMKLDIYKSRKLANGTNKNISGPLHLPAPTGYHSAGYFTQRENPRWFVEQGL